MDIPFRNQSQVSVVNEDEAVGPSAVSGAHHSFCDLCNVALGGRLVVVAISDVAFSRSMIDRGVMHRRGVYCAPHSKRSKFSVRAEKRWLFGQVIITCDSAGFSLSPNGRLASSRGLAPHCPGTRE